MAAMLSELPSRSFHSCDPILRATLVQWSILHWHETTETWGCCPRGHQAQSRFCNHWNLLVLAVQRAGDLLPDEVVSSNADWRSLQLLFQNWFPDQCCWRWINAAAFFPSTILSEFKFKQDNWAFMKTFVCASVHYWNDASSLSSEQHAVRRLRSTLITIIPQHARTHARTHTHTAPCTRPTISSPTKCNGFIIFFIFFFLFEALLDCVRTGMFRNIFCAAVNNTNQKRDCFQRLPCSRHTVGGGTGAGEEFC